MINCFHRTAKGVGKSCLEDARETEGKGIMSEKKNKRKNKDVAYSASREGKDTLGKKRVYRLTTMKTGIGKDLADCLRAVPDKDKELTRGGTK